MNRQPMPLGAMALAALTSLLLTSCESASTRPATVVVAPMCTIQATQFTDNPKNNLVLVADRTDPVRGSGFTTLRGLSFSSPRGNPAIGFTPDVYGISEAWLLNPFSPQVFRAQAHPARRTNAGDFKASAWSINVQNASGTWSPVIATGSANRGEEDTPEAGGETVPQLMPVGLLTTQMFACAGERTQDGAERTTWLIEVTAPGARPGAAPGADLIQDLLNGDDRFVPNAAGPLRGPPHAPTPRVSGPGHPIRTGAVQCAMSQREDDVASRELHMLSIRNGTLYHSMASDFGVVTDGNGSRFNRFRSVSPWGDVAQVLNRNFGTIVSASIVATRPRSVSVFFIAEQNGLYRLWHTVRYSNTGAWRAAADVMALSGHSPNGTVYPYKVAAGNCPPQGASVWTDQNSEQLIALWGGPGNFGLYAIRVVPTPQEWRPGVHGIYSPLMLVDSLSKHSPAEEQARNLRVPSVSVSARPFRDDARPPSP